MYRFTLYLLGGESCCVLWKLKKVVITSEDRFSNSATSCSISTPETENKHVTTATYRLKYMYNYYGILYCDQTTPKYDGYQYHTHMD